MSQEAFGAELKKERESRQISLQDISAATRINVRFLEAIEQGQFGVLPGAYIRAFVREYCETVGLDTVDVLARLEAAMGPVPKAPSESPAVQEEKREEASTPVRWNLAMPELPRYLSLQNVVLTVLAIVALVLIISMIRWGGDGEPNEEVSEIPFDKVIEESAAGAQSQTPGQALPGVTPPKPDSLTLEIQTRDSVWMRLVIDRDDTSEYLFGPQRARTWVAQNRFVLTVGNPTGAEFRLNGVILGSLMSADGRIRNREVSAADLRGQ